MRVLAHGPDGVPGEVQALQLRGPGADGLQQRHPHLTLHRDTPQRQRAHAALDGLNGPDQAVAGRSVEGVPREVHVDDWIEAWGFESVEELRQLHAGQSARGQVHLHERAATEHRQKLLESRVLDGAGPAHEAAHTGALLHAHADRGGDGVQRLEARGVQLQIGHRFEVLLADVDFGYRCAHIAARRVEERQEATVAGRRGQRELRHSVRGLGVQLGGTQHQVQPGERGEQIGRLLARHLQLQRDRACVTRKCRAFRPLERQRRRVEVQGHAVLI
mmetsp:Transcript_149948/g.481837  ORF Transcript_149948/g.481837 Transcript_149948/m.481837 type:complete len:275 (+) Transcript_149948:4416-5240(+)